MDAVKTYGELRHGTVMKQRSVRLGSAAVGTEQYPVATFGVQAVPHVIMRVKRLFPRATNTRAGIVELADTPEIARDLEWLLERWPMRMTEDVATHLAARAAQHRDVESKLDRILAGDGQLSIGWREPARPARPYQQQAADVVLASGRLLLGDDVGLGKSMSSLLVLRDPAALPALVVTLTHLPEQWQGELAATLPWLTGHTLRGGPVYDPADRHGGRAPDVIVTSYSKLAKWGDVLAGRVRTVIFDEVQELRHDGSQKHTAAAQIADRADYRMGLTATPVYNYAGEMHTIMQILAPGVLGTREEFIREWSGTTVGFSQNISLSNASALGSYLRDQGVFLRRTRADVGRQITEPVLVEQPVPTREDVLDEMTRDAAAMARLLLDEDARRNDRFRAAGQLDWTMRMATGVAKAPFVAQFVKLLLESEPRVVLFGWHREVYDIWAEQLAEYQPAFYTGTESVNQKAEAVRAFLDEDHPCRVLCVSLRSGAGLDGLQRGAQVAVFGELDWSPGIHEQCVGRLWRDGQEGNVVAYYMVSDGGTDPLMTEVLGLKQRQSDQIRDPSRRERGPVLTVGSDRVKQLARQVLNLPRDVPAPAPAPADDASGPAGDSEPFLRLVR